MKIFQLNPPKYTGPQGEPIFQEQQQSSYSSKIKSKEKHRRFGNRMYSRVQLTVGRCSTYYCGSVCTLLCGPSYFVLTCYLIGPARRSLGDTDLHILVVYYTTAVAGSCV